MPENNIEPEALPSTSQSVENQKAAMIPLVSLPNVVLTRLDLKNLPVTLFKPSPVKKSVKRLTPTKNKSLAPKSLSSSTLTSLKHDTRFRGKPKKDYKALAEFGEPDVVMTKPSPTKGKTSIGKTGGIVKKVIKEKNKEEDNSVKGMLKKTMLQKRSKIVIPPAKKRKSIVTPDRLNTVLPKPKKEKTNALASSTKKEVAFKMDTDASEDEFLYDELIDELVNSPNKKSVPEKTTNITLKPNAGNKPPTIVKGGIVKKSSLPPDLKAVASPTTLNSSKLAATVIQTKNRPAVVESSIKTPATADTPKASLPTKASPFPIISLTPPKTGPKEQVMKGQKKNSSSKSPVKEDLSHNLNMPSTSIVQSKTQKPISISRPRGRPRLGPKPTITPFSSVNPSADDDSDEYTEVETLENIDYDIEEVPNTSNDSRDEDIQILTSEPSKVTAETDTDRSRTVGSKDGDPHLDLLKILTDDTEVAQSGTSESKDVNSGKSDKFEDTPPSNITVNKKNNSNSNYFDKLKKTKGNNPSGPDANHSSSASDNDIVVVANNDDIFNKLTELPEEPPVKEPRTIYDLMNEVSLKYPSWNLHIIPETDAFCIAQVTKGRLGLPTLKKCIELDAYTYNAKVYIHQYHIKRFDGVYDSEEAILALIEEIHSIKA